VNTNGNVLSVVASPVERVDEPVVDVPAPAPAVAPEPAAGRGQRLLYLSGRPTLKRFIRYVRSHAVQAPPERELSAMWTRANTIVSALAKDEAGAPDNATTRKLGPEYMPLLEQLMADPLIKYGFNTVPTDIVMVELDKLVVYQKHIDLGHANALAKRLASNLSRDVVFRTCLPFDHPVPPVRWTRVHNGEVVFVSPSNDLRSLGNIRLEPGQLANMAPPGQVVGIAGVAVGFGSNFLNAIQCEGRIILNNGSHRAYALRSVGVTHVPCIVQHAANREELALVADSSITDDADYFLRDPRPSMLRDYFDPRLFTVLDATPRLTVVRVKVEVEENWLPALMP